MKFLGGRVQSFVMGFEGSGVRNIGMRVKG